MHVADLGEDAHHLVRYLQVQALEAAQEVPALAPDDHRADLLAAVLPEPGRRGLQQIRIERAAEALVGRNQHQAARPAQGPLAEQFPRGRARQVLLAQLAVEVRYHAVHLHGERPRGQDGVLGALDARGRHHLHGVGYLLDALDGGYMLPYVPQ